MTYEPVNKKYDCGRAPSGTCRRYMHSMCSGNCRRNHGLPPERCTCTCHDKKKEEETADGKLQPQ